jgi:hypothetical protein
MEKQLMDISYRFNELKGCDVEIYKNIGNKTKNIDALVYELYGLIGEVIRIVEGG